MSSEFTPDQWGAIQPVPARSLSERMNYPSFIGIVAATILIAVPLVGLVALVVDIVMILRYVFGYRAPGSPTWSVHHPSVTSLVIVWVVAAFTVVVYPLAIYMSWRLVKEWRDRSAAASKVCPRCAEAVKSAALMCRFCGETFDSSVSQPTASIAQPELTSGQAAELTTEKPSGPFGSSSRRIVLVGVGLAALVFGSLSLIYLGNQVSPVATNPVSPVAENPGGPTPCVISASASAGSFVIYAPNIPLVGCKAAFASIRTEFGPDTAGSSLSMSGAVPYGTPACVIHKGQGDEAQVFTYGASAASLAAEMCAAGNS